MTAGAADIPALMARAQAARAAGDADAAGRLYRRVVRARPGHAGAWLARIELALAEGQARRALRQCTAALPLIPGHRIALLTKRARALEGLGRRAEALALLAGLRAEAPEDLVAALVQAAMAQRAGDLGTAAEAYAEATRLRPDHAGAWLARVDIALARDAAAEAAALAAEAEAHCPAQAPALRARRARALEALDRPEAALALATDLRAADPGDLPLALLEARLRRRTGDLAGAEAAYAAVLARAPDQVLAWLGRIDIAQAAGDPDGALALAAEALVHLPGHAGLIARQAGLMLQTGRTEAAIATLTAALAAEPEAPRLRLDLARAELQAGRFAAAEAQFAACLARDPDDTSARLGLTEAQAARIGAAGLRPLLDRLAAETARMSEPELVRFFKLAEQADHSAAAVAVVQGVAARESLSPLIAQFLMGRARVLLSAAAAARLQQALERRLGPAQRPEFTAFATAMLKGPEEALAQVRALLPPRRDTHGAGLLGERLLDAGQGPATYRYLRACARRWPVALRLRRLFLRAAIESGRLAEAEAWLDSLAARFPDLDLGIDRLQLMIHEGRLEEARALAGERGRTGLPALRPLQMLELALALGDLEAATGLAQRVRSEPGAGRQSVAHFSTTLQGAQFNELRLYRAAEAHALAAGEAPQAARARLARDFFFPAAEIVAAHVGQLGGRPAPEPAVPRRIFQYWNTPEVPAEVAALMQSWQAAAGFEHHLYDRPRALAFLREAYGPRHVRAFQLANSPAEECDFLRLCLLCRHGGVYADADDRLVGDLSRLVSAGPGLILAHEIWGAVANNVICAPPGHPVLLWAMRTAGRSLLARENDGTWFKTGPGLMTRAVAAWIGQATAEELREGLTILPLPRFRHEVRMHVRLGYKTSGAYWNARDRHAPRPVIEALSALD